MNKQQAIKEGLSQTGIYCLHEEAKQRAAKLRKQGFRAVVVNDDGGYRSEVFADDKYFAEMTKYREKQIFDGIPQRIEDIKEDCERRIFELETLQKQLQEKYNF